MQIRCKSGAEDSSKLVRDLNINTNYLETDQGHELLTADWSPVGEYGFTETQVGHIVRNGWTSISAIKLTDMAARFPDYVARQAKTTKPIERPLNRFLSLLAEWHTNGGSNPISFCKTELEKEREQWEKTRIEELRAQAERRAELKELEFCDWYEKLGLDKRLAYVAEDRKFIINGNAKLLESECRTHFFECIWPTLERK